MKPIGRTIEMRHGAAYYRGKYLGRVLNWLGEVFNLPYNGKVRVVIKIGGPYKIVAWGYLNHLYILSTDDVHRGGICKEAFQKLFCFTPDEHERYDIQIKRL